MVAEGFETGNRIGNVSALTAEQKESARVTVCAQMSSVGASPGEIAEMFAMLGIAVHPEGCLCNDC